MHPKIAELFVADVRGVRQFDERSIPLFDVALLAAHTQLDTRARLVNHVNGFVRQKTVGDITIRLIDSGFERVIRVAHLMKTLVTLAHAVENQHGFGLSRRWNFDCLKTAL